MASNILIVEDDCALREAISDTLDMIGYSTVSAENGQIALDILNDRSIDMVVSDIQMNKMDGLGLLAVMRDKYPDIPVILMTAFGTIKQAVDALHEGARDYLVKPFEPEVIVSKVSEFLPARINADEGMVAVDEKTLQITQMAQKVANTEATILITGESGTGKEVLVKFIHQNSSRKDKPFVAINCAAIPDNMLEAILFGYQKGAFTGAYKSSSGKFEQAQGGTLLLDEISEMSLPLQAKLLRVLQEREVERLGDDKTIPLDVRVVATSNRNMQEEVKQGRFREDLYYRLNVFCLEMPALRERIADILPIAEYLLAGYAKDNKLNCPLFDEDVKHRLLTHNWPGNVRELDNVIQRALILHEGNYITVNELSIEPVEHSEQHIENAITDISTKLNGDLKLQERKTILDALEKTGGQRKSAAENLGISPRTLRYKLARMREQGISVPAS